MKRIILVVFACLLPLLALAQEKKEMKLDLKNGTSLTGMVTVQQDGSYLLETSSGDIFFFEVSEVKRATAIAQEPAPVAVPAGNDYYEGKVVYKKRGSLRFYETNEKLAQKDFSTFQGWEKYQKAQKNIKTANSLLIITGGMLVLGGVFAAVGIPNQGEYVMDDGYGWELSFDHKHYESKFGDILAPAGGCLGMAAIPVAITSLVFGIIGNSKLKKMEKAYNQHPGYVIDFGGQQYGVGFALKF